MAKAGTRLAGKANEILEVFTHNVAQFGYDGTNLSDIAAQLSISKGTIVHHYGTKDRLLAALHEAYMRRRLAEAKLLISKLEDPAQQLAGLLFAFMLYQEHDRDATVAFQREVMRLSALDADTEGVSLRTEYIKLVRTVISTGVTVGRFRNSDLRVQSLLMFGSAQWAYTWFDPQGDERAVEVGATLVDLVLGSLLIDRIMLPALADPEGLPARTAQQCLLDSAVPAPGITAS